MTVINNIEIDDIQYKRNIIKEAISNNEPIEDKLNVVIVISNPCLYARRYILTREFIQRIELEENDINLYVVELAYKKQRFLVTDSKNSRHLQIRTEIPIWHKENMINLGIRKLLPKDWKAVAWIDADIEFDSPTWAKDTLKILNGTKDIVQLFSHCIDMNENEEAMNVFSSFGNQFTKGLPYINKSINFWHPGFAWACTRKAYEKMGGLYEKAILGSADNIMALSLIGKGLKSVNEESTEDYKNTILEFQNRVRSLRLGYVPGVIRHFFHGSKKNRKYGDRWQILLKYNYSPSIHVTDDKNGILIPTENCPKQMLDEIMSYFKERNEDEYYEKGKNSANFVKLVETISSEKLIDSDKNEEKQQENDIEEIVHIVIDYEQEEECIDDDEFDEETYYDDASDDDEYYEIQEKNIQNNTILHSFFNILKHFTGNP
jgi:hypothetical protein